MHLDEAHDKVTGAGVKIALLESSLDPSVPELQGQKVKVGPSCNPNGGASKVVRDARDAKVAHGTSMAALLVGNGKGTDQGKGLRGVAPGAEVTLFAVDMFERGKWVDCLRDFGEDDVLKPVIAARPDIVNMSFTFGGGNWEESFEQLRAQGAVLVASAPSSDDVTYEPWSIPGVVSVVAIDRDAKPWAATYPATQNVIAAPGVEVGTGLIDKDGWRSNVWHDGTSAGTAIVSGSLALVKAKYPDATGNQLIQQLIHYTGGTRGYTWSKQLGFGVVSVTKMLETSPTQWPDENPLLKGPQWALADYPMWSSSLIDAPPGTDDQWARAERDAQKDAARASKSSSSSKSMTSDEGGRPAWLLPAVGLAAIALVGGAVALLRRAKTGE